MQLFKYVEIPKNTDQKFDKAGNVFFFFIQKR